MSDINSKVVDGVYYIDTKLESMENIVINRSYISDVVSIQVCDNVKFLSPYMFSNINVVSVKLPFSLKYIPRSCFQDAKYLKNVIISENVEEIEAHAFYGCSSLKNISLPSSLILIKDQAFQGSALEEICIPYGVLSLGSGSFLNCKNLKNVILPSSLKVIKDGSFARCWNLEEIVIPNSVDTIETEAFYFCSSLKKVVLPDFLAKISKYCFDNCGQLNSVVLPKSLKYIETSAFSSCSSLKEIIFPDSLEKIGSAAFLGCDLLTEVVIPKNVVSIGEEVFMYCYSLTNVEIKGEITVLPKKAFHYCKSLLSVSLPSSLKIIERDAFSECYKLEEIVIPEGVEEIGDFAFFQCTKLKRVVLPSTLKKIGKEAFGRCKSLEEIVIPEGVDCIKYATFDSCSSLKKVVIPGSVKVIKECAFRNCCKLKEVVLNEGIKTIGNSAFFGAYSLEKIVFPDSLERIETGAFRNCGFEKIELKNNIKVIKEIAFIYCEKLKEVTLGMDAFEYVASNIFDGCNKELVYTLVNGDNRDVVAASDIILCKNSLNSFLYKYKDNFDYVFYVNGKCHKFSSLDFLKKYPFFAYSDLCIIKAYFWSLNNKFLPHEKIMDIMPVKDIGLFYLNGNSKKWKELVDSMDGYTTYNMVSLFKLAYALGVFQKSGSKSDKAFNFIKEHVLNILSGNAVHEYFDGLDLNNGFDPMWARFFMKYYNDNPNFMTFDGKNLLAASYNNFSSVKKAYPNKVVNTNRNADILLPVHVMYAIYRKIYEKVDEGNDDFALLVGKYGYNEEHFDELQSWYNEGKKFEEKDLKIFISDDTNNDITYELLEKNNPLNAVLGDITNCCQVISGAGESCVKYGMTKPNSKFMTFNYKGDIIGQSWVWYDEKNGIVCLDNIEVPLKYIEKIKCNYNLQKSFVECLERIGNNFINEMEKHNLNVSKVTVGSGYNDIKNVLNDKFKIDEYPRRLSDYDGYSDASKQYIIKKK